MNAGDISEQISEDSVVADSDRELYWVVGVTDTTDLPTVDGFEPIADPTQG